MERTRGTSEPFPSVGGTAAGPLVVVSNRLPYDLRRDSTGRPPKRNVGGLVNAVEPVLARLGGSWVGWDGTVLPSLAAVTAEMSRPLVSETPSGVRVVGVPLSERELARYYHGFANRSLWPLFHDFPGKAVFEPEDHAIYVRVNRRFAEAARAWAGERGRIWVHDYHLMLVPLFLRQHGFRGTVDFFLHIPFPPAEILRVLPWREELLEGLLASDSVAFHTELYRDNFVESANQILGAEPDAGTPGGAIRLAHGGRRTLVVAAPIGIDVEEFERVASLPSVVARCRRIREAHGGRRILFGADRLDYTKGIRERLRAVERFLSSRSQYGKQVIFIQVVVPSRHQVDEYRQMKRDIDREVGRINGELGRLGWVPIHYRYQALDREELVAHYRAADVALVTPLRDGMNLIAAEFAASRVDGDGVLVVSEFAGIAGRCPGALVVNPYDIEGFCRALERALEMDPQERWARMAALRERVRSNPVHRWAERCLGPEAAGGRIAAAGRRRDTPRSEDVEA